MKSPIDVAILDHERRVLTLYHALPPGCRTPWRADGRYALELPPGTLAGAGIAVGERLEWHPAGDPTGADD